MTAEQQVLLDRAKENLEVAKLLYEREYYSIAVSRAYYAMFYVAQAFLREKGLTFSSHSAVIAAFGKEFAATGTLPRELHRYLIDAEDDRLVGDYDLNPALTAEDAEKRIGQAEQFLEVARGELGT